MVNVEKKIHILKMPRPTRRQKQAQLAVKKRWEKSDVVDRNDGDQVYCSPGMNSDAHSDCDASDPVSLEDIGAVFGVCLNHGGLRNVSVLVYFILRYFKID
jgi:hypothetical protein